MTPRATDNAYLQGLQFFADGADLLHIIGDDVVVTGCEFYDRTQHTAAHIDAVQLIPGASNRSQFAGSSLCNAVISNCRFDLRSSMQGIFASDGLFDSLVIRDNVIATQSRHYISFNGLLSAVISGNIDAQGNPVPVLLNPLRIGGEVDGRCVWVIDSPDFEYAPIECDNLTDNRTMQCGRVRNSKLDVYLTDFNLTGFYEAAQDLLMLPATKTMTTLALCNDLQMMALVHGARV